MLDFLWNSSSFPVSGVARRCSRSRGTHRNKSDLDAIFAISGNPSKREVYPPLVGRLKKTLKVNADTGSSYNVIKIWKKQVSCDLVLRTESEFRTQTKSGKYEEI